MGYLVCEQDVLLRKYLLPCLLINKLMVLLASLALLDIIFPYSILSLLPK
jgi:hypothetical protein